MIFAFAADTSRPAPEGAAPLVVQARQIPRLLVTCLNEGRDRQVRFFPFMGVVDGTRRFFDIEEPFDPDQLRSIHGQSDLGFFVDGELSVEEITMRIHAPSGNGTAQVEVKTEFDPRDPWPALQRLMFELTGQLGWRGPVPTLPTWKGPLLGWYLIAKDEQLAAEADMERRDAAASMRAAVEAYSLAPDEPEMAGVLLDTCRTLVARGRDADTVASTLVETLGSLDNVDSSVLSDAALVVEAGRGLDAATPLYVRLARTNPMHPTAAVKAGFGYYQLGRIEEGRELLRFCYERGNRDPALRAQLAAAEEECGDNAMRDRLLDDLATEPELPVPVARLVASYLVDGDRSDEAVALIDRVRAGGVEHAGLWLEHGRALIGLDRAVEAKLSLERCLAIDPEPDIRAEARRLMRLTEDDDLLPDIHELEDALRAGDLRRASLLSRRLVRHRPELAEAWLLLGVVRQRYSQFRRAIRAFARAIELQPDLGDAHNRLGVLLAARGKDLEGYNHLRKAAELMPHDSSPWLHLSQVCLRLGWRDEGWDAFQRAERLGGHEVELEQVRQLFGEEA